MHRWALATSKHCGWRSVCIKANETIFQSIPFMTFDTRRPTSKSCLLQGRCQESPRPSLCQGRNRRFSAVISEEGATAKDEAGVFKKEVVSQMMEDRLYSYLLQHTHEPEVLGQLRAATTEQFPVGARMQISPEQGAFMAWLVSALGAKRVIEVGVFTGYSSIAMALALPPDGRLVACDRDPRSLALAREFWEKAGVADKVEMHEGPAAATLDQLLAAGQQGSYDFAFVDADKRGYLGYHEQLLALVRTGGVIAFDNVLWRGQVADPEAQDKQTAAMRELNAFLMRDDRVDFCLLPLGDGMAMCTKRRQAS